MKHLYICILSLIITTTLYSQVSIGKGHEYKRFKEFKNDECNLIKGKTTVFVIEDLDFQQASAIISSVWTLNKYIILNAEEYEVRKEELKNETYAIFKANVNKLVSYRGNGMTSETFLLNFSYFYYKPKVNKDQTTKYLTEEIARVYLSPSLDYVKQLRASDVTSTLTEGVHNYKLGNFKNYLQIINASIAKETSVNPFENYFNPSKIKDLKAKTLFVPDYFTTKFQMISTSEKKIDIAELFEKYKFKYELISSTDLSQKILDSKEDFYHISYVNCMGVKFVSVTNGLTGEIIYIDSELYSNNVNEGDLKKLNSKIEKS